MYVIQILKYLFILPNPGEFGRLSKPYIKGKEIIKTYPKTRRVFLIILEHARTIESPPTPGRLQYSLNFRGSIKFGKLTEF